MPERPFEPTDDTLVRYVKARTAERWSIGGTAVGGGLVGMVAAAVLDERGVIDADSGLLKFLLVAPILAGLLVAVPVVRWWQRRALGLSVETQKQLDSAFNRALLRKQDPRGKPPAVAADMMRSELQGQVPPGGSSPTSASPSSSPLSAPSSSSLARPPVPHFSAPQLASYFTIQKSLRVAITAPSVWLALGMGASNLVDTGRGPLALLALAGAGVLALWGHRRHRRIVNAAGLSDHELGTLRGAAVQAGVQGGNGSPEDVAGLGRGVVEWHRKQYGG